MVNALSPALVDVPYFSSRPRKVGSRDPFAYLHDLIWIHTLTIDGGARELRLYEVWADPGADDAGVRLVLGLGAPGAPTAAVWDLGLVFESASRLTEVRSRVVVLEVEQRVRGGIRARELTLILPENLTDGSILVVDGVPRRATDDARCRSLTSVLSAQDAEVETEEESVHARLFTRVYAPYLLVQTADGAGRTRSFDVGEDLVRATIETDDLGGIVLRGVDRRTSREVLLDGYLEGGELRLSPRI